MNNGNAVAHKGLIYFRVGMIGSDVDNFSAGGIMMSMRLSTNGLYSVNKCLSKQNENPFDENIHTQRMIFPTGKSTDEIEIDIDECCKYCQYIHEVYFDEIPSIGWDCALTDDGIYIVEGNLFWMGNSMAPLKAFNDYLSVVNSFHES